MCWKILLRSHSSSCFHFPKWCSFPPRLSSRLKTTIIIIFTLRVLKRTKQKKNLKWKQNKLKTKTDSLRVNGGVRCTRTLLPHHFSSSSTLPFHFISFDSRVSLILYKCVCVFSHKRYFFNVSESELKTHPRPSLFILISTFQWCWWWWWWRDGWENKYETEYEMSLSLSVFKGLNRVHFRIKNPTPN